MQSLQPKLKEQERPWDPRKGSSLLPRASALCSHLQLCSSLQSPLNNCFLHSCLRGRANDTLYSWRWLLWCAHLLLRCQNFTYLIAILLYVLTKLCEHRDLFLSTICLILFEWKRSENFNMENWNLIFGKYTYMHLFSSYLHFNLTKIIFTKILRAIIKFHRRLN